MTVAGPVDAEGTRRRTPPADRWWPSARGLLAAAAGASLLLPWWRADVAPVLLGPGPVRSGPPDAVPPDSWTGLEVAGLRAVPVLVLAVAAVAAAVVGVLDRDRDGGRDATVVAGAAAAACGTAALVGWGPSGAVGAWCAVAAGLVAAGGAAAPGRPPRHRRAVLITALVAAVVTVALPPAERPPDRTAVGPFQRVAALGAWWRVRSGAAGLPGSGYDARPVVVDGASGVVTGDGVVVVADARGRARVLARPQAGAPPPLGVVGGRVVRRTADTLVVTELRAGGPLRVVVHDVDEAGRLGDDGSVWLRSHVDPPETVRRLDVAAYAGEQDLPATYLPVVTIQSPDGEPPVDVRTARPVPGGALRQADVDRGPLLELLTGTAAGIAVRAVTDPPSPRCFARSLNGIGDVRRAAADTTGVWYPTADGYLAHRAPDGTVRTVRTRLPGPVLALAAPGDGSVVFVGQDLRRDTGAFLWRLPAATAALGDPATCRTA